MKIKSDRTYGGVLTAIALLGFSAAHPSAAAQQFCTYTVSSASGMFGSASFCPVSVGATTCVAVGAPAGSCPASATAIKGATCTLKMIASAGPLITCPSDAKFLWGFSIVSPPSQPATSPIDVTAKLDNLGIPYAQEYPQDYLARNVWDMAIHDQRVYLTAGNLDSDDAPKTKVMYWDPASNSFVDEYTTNDDAIMGLRNCYGTLCIPGADASQSWYSGNVYLHQLGEWQRKEIPRALHVNEMGAFDGALFAGYLEFDQSCDPTVPGPYPSSCFHESIGISTDLGTTWKVQRFGDGATAGDITAFFTFKGTFYAAMTPTSTYPSSPPLFAFDGMQFNPISVDLIPSGYDGLLWGPSLQPGAIEMGGKLVYLGAYIYGMDPNTLWVADSSMNVKQLTMPAGARPRDLLLVERKALDARLLVLTATKQGTSGYRMSVFSSKNLSKWHEMFTFTASTFARCFAYLNGEFFFALGGYGTENGFGEPYLEGDGFSAIGADPAVGTVLRLRSPNLPVTAWD